MASAASTSVMLYRHSNIDKVTSRAARNVAVSICERGRRQMQKG